MPPLLPPMLDVFSAEVIPLLQKRGLFRTAYAGKTLREHYGLPWPNSAFLHVPSLELGDVPVRVREASPEGEVTVELLELGLAQRRALVTHLYCRPGQWDRPPRSELRAMWEYLRAGLRMYPLAESA